MEECFVAIKIEFASGERRDPRDEEYGDDAAEFYQAASEVLGAGDFDSPMTLLEDHVETYVYISGDSPGESGMSATPSRRPPRGCGVRVLPCGSSAS